MAARPVCAASPAIDARAAKAVAVEADRPDLEFSFHRLGPGGGATLLVVGGIQGDEPGGFSAASLLVTNYTITSGQVWVVPNLNFPSIVNRSRGAFGDMNRKFAHVSPEDPDYPAVMTIQEIIRAPEVDLILNLHDGSGFYRPQYESPMHNPKRWGQCVIIDQDCLDAAHRFSRLSDMALTAVKDANKGLLKDEHQYHLRNTETRKGDKEMEKTLSYYAVRHNKPAFGLEASKNFTTEFRAYYHLQVLESFMRQMGITFERKFSLSPDGVKDAINSDVGIALYDNRLVLALDNVRPSLTFVPMKKGAPVELKGTKPLLAMLQEKKNASWRVAYGNRTLTRLSPQYMDFDESLSSVDTVQDGKTASVPLGQLVTVTDSFLVKSVKGFRVNAIGAMKDKADGSECNVTLRKKDFLPRYSVDKDATTYRVEIYKGKAFAGMILVRFGKTAPASRDTMTATKGPESDFGF
ncbi:Purine nucleoside phosphorylase [uncultured delta proteobacterium]|uniref:Purine nucleoside phosphorylase n=1 Tax=uncultured delta proteobacterium TaxID=34034 RepID=A0A212JUG1_9DELT|nr:Purine nucleoside phosphorylase [uncultured delta proteobacterium]